MQLAGTTHHWFTTHCVALTVCSHACYVWVQGKWEGVHAFAVRIRDDNLKVLPNIRIKVTHTV